MTIGELWRRLRYLASRRRIERELAEEMAVHRGMMTDPRRFGNMLKLREDARDVWGWGPLDGAWQDLRHALRALRKSPSFSITSIAILTLGIGVNMTFFNLINVTMLQPVPIADPATLVRFERHGPTFSSSGVPFPAIRFIREHNDVFASVLTRHGSDVVWDQDPASRISVAYVSANWFDELGFDAALGRTFSERIDERPGAEPAVMVSERFWRTTLGSDPTVVGRTLRLNDRPAIVVGVVPDGFPDLDLRDPQLWLPIAEIDYFEPGSGFKEAWHSNNTEMYARLRPGVTLAAAAEGVRPALSALARLHPSLYKDDEWLEPATAEERFLHRRDRRKVMRIAALFGGLTLLVLLVACANLANLVLSHAIGRLREFSVRCALGASRWRVLRHIVIECGILAAIGAAGGIAAGYASARLFASFTTELPPYLDFAPDRRVLGAAMAAVFVAMLAFGVVPAWMVSRRDLIRAI
jgi:predicted permease